MWSLLPEKGRQNSQYKLQGHSRLLVLPGHTLRPSPISYFYLYSLFSSVTLPPVEIFPYEVEQPSNKKNITSLTGYLRCSVGDPASRQ